MAASAAARWGERGRLHVVAVRNTIRFAGRAGTTQQVGTGTVGSTTDAVSSSTDVPLVYDAHCCRGCVFPLLLLNGLRAFGHHGSRRYVV